MFRKFGRSNDYTNGKKPGINEKTLQAEGVIIEQTRHWMLCKNKYPYEWVEKHLVLRTKYDAATMLQVLEWKSEKEQVEINKDFHRIIDEKIKQGYDILENRYDLKSVKDRFHVHLIKAHILNS